MSTTGTGMLFRIARLGSPPTRPADLRVEHRGDGSLIVSSEPFGARPPLAHVLRAWLSFGAWLRPHRDERGVLVFPMANLGDASTYDAVVGAAGTAGTWASVTPPDGSPWSLDGPAPGSDEGLERRVWHALGDEGLALLDRAERSLLVLTLTADDAGAATAYAACAEKLRAALGDDAVRALEHSAERTHRHRLRAEFGFLRAGPRAP